MATVVAVAAVSVVIREWPVAAIPPAVSGVVAGHAARPIVAAEGPDAPLMVRAAVRRRVRTASQPAVHGSIEHEPGGPPHVAAVTAAVVVLPDAPGSDLPLVAGGLPIELALAPGLVAGGEVVVPVAPSVVSEASGAPSVAVAADDPVSRAFVVAGRGIATGLRVAGARLRAVF